MSITPAPKPPMKVKEPKQLRRHTPMPRATEPIPKINVGATKKRMARRAKQRRSPAERACRTDAWERARGLCECGKCGGLPFDKTFGQFHSDFPEFHHDQYEDTLRHKAPRGRYVRRGCHHFLEMTEHSTRAPRRKAVGG